MERIKPKHGQILNPRDFILRKGDKIRSVENLILSNRGEFFEYKQGQDFTIEKVLKDGGVYTKERSELERELFTEGLYGLLSSFIFISGKRKRLTSDRLPR